MRRAQVRAARQTTMTLPESERIAITADNGIGARGDQVGDDLKDGSA